MTGKGIYRYFKIVDNQSMRATHSQLTKKEALYSSHYNSHIWTENRLIIFTERGEILLAELNGDFKMFLNESPQTSFTIRYAMNTKGKGFIIADNAGRYMVFDETNDPKTPFRLIKDLVSSTCNLNSFFSQPLLTAMSHGAKIS